MTVQFKTLYRTGLKSCLLLVMGLGLTADASAQQSSVSLQSRLENIWSRIVRDDDDKDPAWGKRGEMCAIAPTHPQADTPESWHAQPVIVWQAGTVAQISMRELNAAESFWKYTPSGDETHVVYDGDPLAPGKTYVLGIHATADADPALVPSFQVLPATIRTLISNGLENSSSPNHSAVSDAEWTAIEQAEYFSTRDLPYDAIQSLFSVSNPSADLLNIQERIIASACQRE